MTLNYWMMVAWRDTQILRERLAVRLPAMKSPLYLTKTWRWLVGLLSQINKQLKKIKNHSSTLLSTKWRVYIKHDALYREPLGFKEGSNPGKLQC